jgi:hypothetical protein
MAIVLDIECIELKKNSVFSARLNLLTVRMTRHGVGSELLCIAIVERHTHQ